MADEKSGPSEGVKGVVEDVKGKAKEAVGAVSGNDDLTREGRAQQDKAEDQREVARKEAEAEKARRRPRRTKPGSAHNSEVLAVRPVSCGPAALPSQGGVTVVRILTLVVLIWLVVGAVAAGQRGGYFSNSEQNCAGVATVVVTVIAGPLNYFGVNPRIEDCRLPEPSS